MRRTVRKVARVHLDPLKLCELAVDLKKVAMHFLQHPAPDTIEDAMALDEQADQLFKLYADLLKD